MSGIGQLCRVVGLLGCMFVTDVKLSVLANDLELWISRLIWEMSRKEDLKLLDERRELQKFTSSFQ